MLANDPWRRRSRFILTAILLIGAALRLVNLGQSPPGLNQDEAVNAWDAYCLLTTGHDQHGTAWPVFYARSIGDNRSTLFLYYLMPFQAVGGLSIYTARFAVAFGGVLTLLLIYYLGTRMFGRPVGLVAAGLMAVNPWHVQQCRWALEAALQPLQTSLCLAAWLWAGLPLDDHDESPRPYRAAVAGAVTGICCYGYPAIRLFLVLFFCACVALTWRTWWRRMTTRSGRLAVGLLALCGSATFLPLAWYHWAHSDVIGRRLQSTHIWADIDSPWVKAAKVLSRYPLHFDPNALFFSGDISYIQSPPGSGLFHPYMMPLMLAGLLILFPAARRSRSARVVLAWVVLYPVGDLVGFHATLHALRSLPGLCGLILLAAVGAVGSARWMYTREPRMTRAIGIAAVVVALFFNAMFFKRFFVDFNREKDIFLDFGTDLVQACDWLRPRLPDIDAVYCTTERLNMPYAVTLVGLKYDPRQWFADERERMDLAGWDACVRYGKIRFLYPERPWTTELEQFRAEHRQRRVIFIVRPSEIAGLRPTWVIYTPHGQESLWVCDQRM